MFQVLDLRTIRQAPCPEFCFFHPAFMMLLLMVLMTNNPALDRHHLP